MVSTPLAGTLIEFIRRIFDCQRCRGTENIVAQDGWTELRTMELPESWHRYHGEHGSTWELQTPLFPGDNRRSRQKRRLWAKNNEWQGAGTRHRTRTWDKNHSEHRLESLTRAIHPRAGTRHKGKGISCSSNALTLNNCA